MDVVSLAWAVSLAGWWVLYRVRMGQAPSTPPVARGTSWNRPAKDEPNTSAGSTAHPLGGTMRIVIGEDDASRLDLFVTAFRHHHIVREGGACVG
jgi:hypothetical protein